MPTTSKDDVRRDRLREFDALSERAAAALSALALIVQGREARAASGDAPLEVAFAQAGGDGPTLPAGLWVALRRGDIEMALDLLSRASTLNFVVGEREEMGSGYRLETVEETRPLPDVELLEDRLATVVGIPRDVVAVLAHWGPDDPRTRAEVDALLDSRSGMVADVTGPPPAAHSALVMSVSELAAVLQLEPAQALVLATLSRRAELTIAPSPDCSPDSSQPTGGPIVAAAGPHAAT
jgi:hypothetical protein